MGSGTNPDYQSQSNQHQSKGGASNLKKLNNTEVIYHNSLSSIFPAEYMATVANSGENVNKMTSSRVDLTPNIPGNTIIEESHAAARLANTEEITLSWPFVNENFINDNSIMTSTTFQIELIKIISVEQFLDIFYGK